MFGSSRGSSMSRRDRHVAFHRLASLCGLFALAGLLAGCFYPLYGESTLPGGQRVKEALAGVEVAQISAQSATSEDRLAVQIYNDLVFNFTDGGARAARTHQSKS